MSIAIVISSFSENDDAVSLVIGRYQELGRSLGAKLYLISNTNKYFADVTNIPLKMDNGYINNFIKGIHAVNENYVIVGFDDILIHKYNEKQIKELINYGASNELNYLRLTGRPRATGLRVQTSSNLIIRKIEPNELYQNSLVLSLYERRYLIKCLTRAKSAWSLDKNIRHDNEAKAFATESNLFSWSNLLAKGKIDLWELTRAELIEGTRLKLNTKRKKVFSITRVIKKLSTPIINRVSPRLLHILYRSNNST